MAVRSGISIVLVLSAMLCAGMAAGAARQQTKAPLNPANEKLLKLPPAERAAILARVVAHWCIGTEAFEMGVIAEGRGRGNAYWSLKCADGSAWAIQIDPSAAYTAIDCQTYKEKGEGKECFKKF